MRLALALAFLAAAPLPLRVALAAGHTSEAGLHAAQAPSLQVTTEEQAAFSRLILPAAPRGRYSVRRIGNTLTVLRPRGATLADPAVSARNVLTWSSGPDTTKIVFPPGIRLHISQPGRSLVIDAYNPVLPPVPPGKAAVPAGRTVSTPLSIPTIAIAGAVRPPVANPAPTVSVQAEPLPQVATASHQSPVTPVAAPPAPEPTTQAPAATLAAAPPVRPALQIQRITGTDDPTILLPAAQDVGLAAFLSGGELVVVLDAPVDFQPPAPGPAFSGLSSQRMQDATIIRIPLADPDSARVVRSPDGWRISAGKPVGEIASILPRLVEEQPGVATLRFAASQPSRVVSAVDPGTGALLLIGTQRVVGEAVAKSLRYVQFTLYPTVQGIVVAASSDDIRLRREAGGFTLSAGPHAGGTILSARDPSSPTATLSAPLSRLFTFHNDPLPTQIETLRRNVLAAANAPALARAQPRLNVAEAMVALGMGVEAQSVLAVAVADDPTLQDKPIAMALRAVAGIIAGRLDTAVAINDPRLGHTTEGDLWSALLQVALTEVTPADAKSLAAGLPVLMEYPSSLQDRLLPRALEAMALNGQAAAAQATLVTLPERPELDLARGMTFEALGQPTSAMQAYEQVKNRMDRLPRYRATVRAAELHLKDGSWTVKQTADALDQALFGWREPRDERLLRTRIAALRQQSGQWREALAVLTDGRTALPEERVLFDAEIAKTLTKLFAGDGAEKLPPADLVSLYDKNLDVIQAMTWPQPVGLRLVDRLSALGLQGRAEPVMMALLAKATDPGVRPSLGARLAALRLDMTDPAGAIAALADSAPLPSTPVAASTMENRQLLYAQAESSRGNKALALTMLKELNTAVADDARADIYTAMKNWPMAVSALAALEQKSIASPDTLTVEQQGVVMRLAVAATLSGDSATLTRIAGSYATAMASGPSADLFRLVTSNPVRGTADLPRAFDEIKLARKLPAELGGTALP